MLLHIFFILLGKNRDEAIIIASWPYIEGLKRVRRMSDCSWLSAVSGVWPSPSLSPTLDPVTITC